MRFVKTIATALALTVGGFSFVSAADAGYRSDALVGGIIGFGAGALVGSALARPYYQPAPVYVAPARVYHAPIYYYAAAPWTPEWYSHCSHRYRSFNPQTGYFLGYDGQYHFCR